MAQVIDIPSIGSVEFPDTMSDADITAAVKRLHTHAMQTVGSQPFSEPTGYWGGFGAGLKEGAVGGAQGFVKGLVSSPADFVTGTVQSVRHPIETVKGLWGTAKAAPQVARSLVGGQMTPEAGAIARDPQAWGQAVGSQTGQAMLTAGLARAPETLRLGASAADKAATLVDAQTTGGRVLRDLAGSAVGESLVPGMTGRLLGGAVAEAAPGGLRAVARGARGLADRLGGSRTPEILRGSDRFSRGGTPLSVERPGPVPVVPDMRRPPNPPDPILSRPVENPVPSVLPDHAMGMGGPGGPEIALSQRMVPSELAGPSEPILAPRATPRLTPSHPPTVLVNPDNPQALQAARNAIGSKPLARALRKQGVEHPGDLLAQTEGRGTLPDVTVRQIKQQWLAGDAATRRRLWEGAKSDLVGNLLHTLEHTGDVTP